MMKYIIIIIAVITSIGCNRQKQEVKEKPLIAVIKLQSAEANLNFEEAKKYIDVKSVFGKHPESKNPEKEWKDMVSFFYNLGNNKKFTSQFKYYNYDITESVDNSKARISFIAIDKGSRIKEINYTLYRINDKWKIVDIQYSN